MKEDFRTRLRTVDEVGKRIWVYADIFQGPWRQKRQILAYFLILFYLALPWISFRGLPVFQLDIMGQRLIIAGLILLPHELGVIIPLVLAFIFGVFSLTAIFGRAWCGWGCPQTVFMEFVYRPIEKWIEGSPLKRKALNQSPWGLKKAQIKFIKWSVYVLINFIISNSFLAYLVGSSNLLKIVSAPPSQHPILFAVMILFCCIFLFNFGWFREQMCTITCPYGRLQSMLTDRNTLTVGYNPIRGEPRGKKQGGDCVDCYRCVQVCPTGIDIRDGTQLECINCLACVDACDAVMAKIGKVSGLVSYTTESKTAGLPSKLSWKRAVIYSLLAFSFIGISVFQLINRVALEAEIVRSGAVHFEKLGEQIANRLEIRLKNKSEQNLKVNIRALEDDCEVVLPEMQFILKPQETRSLMAFMKVAEANFKTGTIQRTLIFNYEPNGVLKTPVTLFGPQI